VQQWRERTPEGFIFAAKIPQSITHEKCLVGADGDLNEFVGVMDLLGPKLGPLLIQLPYFNKQRFDGLDSFLRVLEPFLALLPRTISGRWKSGTRTGGREAFLSPQNYGVAYTLIDQSWMPRPGEFSTWRPIHRRVFTYVRWLGDRKGIEKQTLVLGPDYH